jgi:acyl-CoA dehydrogenase
MHTNLVAIGAWLWRRQNGTGEPLLRRVAEEQIVLVSISGSDWLEGSGRAERVPGGFRVSDRKTFSSGAPAGEVLMTTAVWDDPKIGPTVLYLPVSMHDQGVRIVNTRQAMGMRGTDSNDILLENVFVPDEAILVRRAYGRWHPLMHVVAQLATPLIHSVYVGLAEAARDLALQLAAKERDDTGLQYLAGEMENALVGTQLALREMVSLATTGQASASTTNRMMICRTLVGQGALRTVDRAMDVAGRASFYHENRLERIFRDVQAARYHPLQEKMQERYAGRVALGLPIDRD